MIEEGTYYTVRCDLLWQTGGQWPSTAKCDAESTPQRSPQLALAHALAAGWNWAPGTVGRVACPDHIEQDAARRNPCNATGATDPDHTCQCSERPAGHNGAHRCACEAEWGGHGY